MLAQPISLAGVPVLSAPLKRPGQLPLGLQLIGAPGREGLLFDLAARLEVAGVLGV
jgi:aspartyl-tRNA(Asn)/glutamyl-tRNA(Gln) amidotransferase subunit A